MKEITPAPPGAAFLGWRAPQERGRGWCDAAVGHARCRAHRARVSLKDGNCPVALGKRSSKPAVSGPRTHRQGRRAAGRATGARWESVRKAAAAQGAGSSAVEAAGKPGSPCCAAGGKEGKLRAWTDWSRAWRRAWSPGRTGRGGVQGGAPPALAGRRAWRSGRCRPEPGAAAFASRKAPPPALSASRRRALRARANTRKRSDRRGIAVAPGWLWRAVALRGGGRSSVCHCLLFGSPSSGSISRGRCAAGAQTVASLRSFSRTSSFFLSSQ